LRFKGKAFRFGERFQTSRVNCKGRASDTPADTALAVSLACLNFIAKSKHLVFDEQPSRQAPPKTSAPFTPVAPAGLRPVWGSAPFPKKSAPLHLHDTGAGFSCVGAKGARWL